ncbi:glutaminase A [Actinoplanes sp. NPDC049118]|uniref:glutaminase A n=1 Tax=Actinoplanes sp. NPDC049118 TaxID=3155769 RepID=UPI0033EC38E4
MFVDRGEPPFVSTGRLPPSEVVTDLVRQAHQRYASDDRGSLSTVYPALTRVPPGLFGVAATGTAGDVYAAGDADVLFTVMSIAKPFVFALVCDAIGADEARRAIGVNATGLAFNSLAAVERGPAGRTNPMVNPGAIATTSLAPGGTPEARWGFLADGLSRFAGRPLSLDAEMYASASQTNQRNRAMAHLLDGFGGLGCDAAEALDLYTRQSSLLVSARDLAVMGSTLADGGLNPITGVQVISAESCRCALAVMTTAGLYETSGDWLYDVGLPGKSGIGGGIVTVSPGKGGLGTFAPLLDEAGNSVKGQLAAAFLSRRLGLDLFASQAAEGSR